MTDKLPASRDKGDVLGFVAEAQALAPAARDVARVIFAVDATQSREATWDLATGLQMQMFDAAAALGGIGVQLVYFRGLDECRASRWHLQPRPLIEAMGRVRCMAGHTQIARVLRHALRQRQEGRVAALVLVGDACEESADELVGLAGQLRLVSVPVFAFHEGPDRNAERLFRDLARVSGGAFHPFDRQSPRVLADALRAVAVYASGGAAALQKLAAREGGTVRQIAQQIGR